MLNIKELTAIPGSFLLRKHAIRALAGSNHFFTSLLILVLSIFLHLALNLLLIPSGIINEIWNFLIDVFLFSLIWITGTYIMVEPALNLVLFLSSADEAELHWWAQQKRITRKVAFSAVALGKLLFLLLNIIFLSFPGYGFVPVLLFHFFLLIFFSAFIHYQWNHKVFTASILAILPFLACIVLEITVTLPALLILLFLLLSIPLVFFCSRDLLLKRSLKDFRSENKTDAVAHMLELIHQSAASAKAEMELRNINSYPPQARTWISIRLFSATERFLEAIDLGLEALEMQNQNVQLHLALAEASLGARDGENCVAHAEAALELAGDTALTSPGQEALLFIALGSFSLGESATGLLACRRVLDIKHISGGIKKERIRKELQMLEKKFASQSMEDD